MTASSRTSTGVTRSVVAADGTRLAYDVAGAGPLVLLIQGVGVAGTGWAPQVEALRDSFTAVTFDNRGIGRSARGPDPLTIETMADDALAILDAERCERAHIVGHSMGGPIALRLALARPARVRSLALLCTFANGADATRFSWRMAALGLRSRVGTRAMRRNAMLEMVLTRDYIRAAGRDVLARDLEALFGRDLADQPPIVGEQLSAMSRFDATPGLSALARLPTLVVSGAHDPIAPPPLGRALAAAIPGARYEEFEDASHALPIQLAHRTNVLLRQHLETLAQAGG